ncbi:MAG: Glyoxalase-like domain protein [Gemmatimonadetes bacterium]|nr:Glyoxalase-like domain protein [Gemmatimonadota bacterium]
MISSLGRTVLLVRDHDEALAFYRDALGFTVLHDHTAGGQRYLHVGVPGQPGDPPVGLWLMKAGPADDALVGRQARGQPLLVLYTDACRAEVERLRERGVRVNQEPAEGDGAVFAHVADLYGNDPVLVQMPAVPAPSVASPE